MTGDKTQGGSVNVRTLSDLCTPWCVHVVATLRIADHIAASTTDIKTLAEETGCDPGSLLRVLRHLVGQGVFAEPTPGRFELNEAARDLEVNVDTVRLWRDRWVGLQGIGLETLGVAEHLHDAPRPGAHARITAEQRCQIAALACEAPSKTGRPISQWTGREIAHEVIRRGIVAQISLRHAAHLLKKGACNRTASAIG